MNAALGWLLFGNLVSAVAWRRRVPINGGPLYALLAAVLYANAWRDRRLRAEAPALAAGALMRRLAAAAVVGLALSAPGVLAFRLPFVQRRLAYTPIERMARAALARRLLFEIPLMTALSEELLFRGSLLATAPPPGLATRLGRNAAVFTAWHLVVTLRTVGDTGFGRRPLGLIGAYLGSLLSVFVGGVALGAVRLRTRSILCAAVTHWVADAALTLAAWLT